MTVADGVSTGFFFTDTKIVEDSLAFRGYRAGTEVVGGGSSNSSLTGRICANLGVGGCVIVESTTMGIADLELGRKY